MRTFSTTVMAALIIAALFWGNCFSCPQVILAAKKHGCCPHTKSSKTECQTQALKNFVKAETSAPAVAVPIVAANVEPLQAVAFVAIAPEVPITTQLPPEILSLRI